MEKSTQYGTEALIVLAPVREIVFPVDKCQFFKLEL
jgi:hypothetical protein